MNTFKSVGDATLGILNWVYSIPPASFSEYEAVLLAFAATVLHLNLSTSQQASDLAIGLAVYGLLKAVREVVQAIQSAQTVKA